jgi:hypothetical protein
LLDLLGQTLIGIREAKQPSLGSSFLYCHGLLARRLGAILPIT